jgi:hypothetical protein
VYISTKFCSKNKKVATYEMCHTSFSVKGTNVKSISMSACFVVLLYWLHV